MKFQASRPATLLKSDSSDGVFQCILQGNTYKVQGNTHFVENLQTAASELVRY